MSTISSRMSGTCTLARTRLRRYADLVGSKQDTLTNANLRNLPIEERIKLVEDLWDSIAEDRRVLPVTPEQKAELDRRLRAYEVDKNRGRPAADALADVRRRL